MKKLFFSMLAVMAGGSAMAQGNVHGHVTMGNQDAVFQQVFLISACVDSMNQTTILTAIDSTMTDTTGSYYFSNVAPAGTNCWLTVKAGSSSASYLPTYYDSALNWNNATSVMPNPANSYNIYLIPGVNPGGPGFIGGDVQQGANKGTAVGDPLAGRIVLLTGTTNNVVAYTYSNASGAFSFSNLPYGTYKLFGDAGGKTNPALTVTINAATPSISKVIFNENDETFEGHISTTGIQQQLLNGAVATIYPNPATNVVYVKGIEAVPGAKTITIRSMNGATVATQKYAAGEQVTANVAALAAGVYTVQIATEAGTTVLKMVK